MKGNVQFVRNSSHAPSEKLNGSFWTAWTAVIGKTPVLQFIACWVEECWLDNVFWDGRLRFGCCYSKDCSQLFRMTLGIVRHSIPTRQTCPWYFADLDSHLNMFWRCTGKRVYMLVHQHMLIHQYTRIHAHVQMCLITCIHFPVRRKPMKTSRFLDSGNWKTRMHRNAVFGCEHITSMMCSMKLSLLQGAKTLAAAMSRSKLSSVAWQRCGGWPFRPSHGRIQDQLEENFGRMLRQNFQVRSS